MLYTRQSFFFSLPPFLEVFGGIFIQMGNTVLWVGLFCRCSLAKSTAVYPHHEVEVVVLPLETG